MLRSLAVCLSLTFVLAPMAMAVQPKITSIEPPVAKPLTELRILGSDFGGAAGNAVTIGGKPCQITNLLNWEVRCIVPHGDGTNLPVQFSNYNGTSNAAAFSYDPSPAISGRTPEGVMAPGGEGTLTLSGYRFGTSGAQVKIGETPCPVIAQNANNIACAIPQGSAGIFAVTVTVNGLTSNSVPFTYDVGVSGGSTSGSSGTSSTTPMAPSITSLTPSAGAAGGTLRIQGVGWPASSQTPRVTIGNLNCPVSGYNGLLIDCTIPIGDGSSLPVVVTNTANNLTSNPLPFSYDATPAITAILPRSDYDANILTVSGYRFAPGASVSIGNANCPVTFQREGTLYCTIPPGSGTQSVTVTSGGLRSNAVQFAYGAGPTLRQADQPPGPRIQSISPAVGQSGTTVTITGGGWGTAGAAVVLAGAPCAVTSLSETQITCTIPPGSGSMLPLLVVNAAGAWSLPKAFSYGVAGPSWTALGFEATDIGVGANGQVWFIGANGSSIYRLVNGAPQLMSGAATRITVDPNGVAWVVNAAGQIWRWTGSTWMQTVGAAQDIGAGANGAVWVTGPDKSIHRWTGTTWIRMSGEGMSIAADSSGWPWVANAGNLWRYNGSSWLQVPGAASDLAIAGTHVFAIGTNGAAMRLVNGAWETFGVTGVRIAVAPDGKAYLARGAGHPAMIFQ